MASPLRPQFFCTRPNGSLTPLIAVDDLPAHITIRGVPRVLSPNDTQGMTSLGTINPRPQSSYIVEGMPPPVSSRTSPTNVAPRRPREYDMQNSLMRLATDENVPTNQRLAVSALLQQGATQNWTVASPSSPNSWLVANGGGGGSGSSRQQQGCLYKHEMPTDPGTLEKLGLRDIPRWYREKFSIPSLLPNGHALPRSHPGPGQPWKDDASDRSTIKAIQYPSRLGANGAIEISDAEKGSKQRSANYAPSHPHSAIVPGHLRGGYHPTDSPKGMGNQRYGPKNANKKIDLLGFGPLPEYSPLDSMGAGVGGINYPDARENMALENTDRVKREDLVRNLQSLMPSPIVGNPDYMVSSFDPAYTTQSRSKKGQKSRRLFQPRSQFGTFDISPDKSEIDSLRNYHAHATASSSAASGMSKDTVDSHLPSPITVPPISVNTPTRGGSPSMHSAISLSSESSPCGFRRNRRTETDPKIMPAPIGSKRTQHKRAGESSDDDF
ncbi:hypothetical protein FE257_002918 [Aspergillus nanangensis]|uniref:Uncharacterized protein n=1 Tax=Aspergillus nanangensis TaxID=2582783 RepID=A0AAD4GWR7_ASPNN|nr:hypothetical protein FE257_002918 [Aspergillus nanangensis]